MLVLYFTNALGIDTGYYRRINSIHPKRRSAIPQNRGGGENGKYPNQPVHPAAGVTLIALAFWGAWGLWQEAGAHSIGWKWAHPRVLVVTERNTGYSEQIILAVADYTNTEILITWCKSPCPSPTNVIHVPVHFGRLNQPVARAIPYSRGVNCVSNPGHCNESNHKVDFAYIQWNVDRGPYNIPTQQYVSRHEMGHVLGLRHTEDVKSVMCSSCPLGFSLTLQTHDIEDINSMY